MGRGGKFVIKPRFQYAREFSEGLAAAREEGKIGFIDNSGRWAIAPRFGDAWEFGRAWRLWKSVVVGRILTSAEI